MNVKQAADKWQVKESTVKKYCKEGMIPLAEKIGMRWEIPDECEKPLVTRHTAAVLMTFITQFEIGARPNLSRLGIKADDIEAVYPFLADMGFISRLNAADSLAEKLQGVRVLSSGLALIERENEVLRKKGGLQISGDVRLNAGIMQVGANLKYEK